MAGGPVIDAHHHFWELDRFPYRWLSPDAGPARFGDKAAIRRDYLPEDYLAATSAITLAGSVHVQANCGAADPVDETRWLDALAAETGWPTAIVAEVDLAAPGASALIRAHAGASGRLRGIRTPVAWDEAGRWRVARAPQVLRDPAVREAARELIARDLVLEMVVVPAQLPEVAELAGTMPDLRIVIDHFATLEPGRPGNAADWRSGIAGIATTRGVSLKLSGLWTAERSWAPEVLAPFLDHAVSSLGPGRIMYGSNLPVEGVNCGFEAQMASLEQLLSGYCTDARRALFHDTARDAYRLE